MNKAILVYIILGIILNVHFDLKAQETPIVASRKIEKKFEYNRRGQIIIDAERGNINIQSWNRDEISVVLTITVKNMNQSLASQELGYMQYNLEKNRENVFINNKMVLPDADKNREITSIIWATYEIRIPEKADILINNKFGLVTIKGISGLIHGDIRYTDMMLQEYKGDIHLNISVGDLNCQQSVLTGEIKARHANVSIHEITGKLKMQTEYGSITLINDDKLNEFELTSYATDIHVDNKGCHPFDIKINGSYCPLTIAKECYTPENKFLKSTYQTNPGQPSWLLQYIPQVNSSRLRIDARFGTINLL